MTPEATRRAILLGNIAQDDPEGQEVFESLYGLQEERILILSAQDTALVNALQRRASPTRCTASSTTRPTSHSSVATIAPVLIQGA